MSLVDKLKWRYATKKFDNTQKIASEKLDYILEATQLAPSSLGLQPYRILVVEDAAIREQLKEASHGQTQITDASQLIVFAVENNLNEEFGKKYIDNVAAIRNVPRESLAGFEGMVLGTINGRSKEELKTWSQKQAYIALGVLIAAASEQSVDICPMEGFDVARYNDILNLTEKGLTATVIATVGYRASDDAYAQLAKVRRAKEELFIHV
ncbi:MULTISPECIES: NAD(P)H-dependent oxidoreductase [unclassified Mucilaginibacter]|uniref:NAD(P)H-dependent oxidoreductase n=1 Tax=unclassified Mucilaginibacter TaxID=2617802 RepID=UPI0009609AFE|nr:MULTISPECIES: NAD(P)H-dependent oxidoreductase [unclassified Mucilaginibacter]OJW17429.1 MAG: NAD(P)H-dependent oxidoreductase [Mucilaginibacter sp. 44-25]PLW90393.1 MAG: NAD(P)H-dependent oxidoreductase [Mucilaginibacter sp.]HEK20402.1 NAD(P)H-dependent oxidoreductase [Bacteroidota bacterium]